MTPMLPTGDEDGRAHLQLIDPAWSPIREILPLPHPWGGIVGVVPNELLR